MKKCLFAVSLLWFLNAEIVQAKSVCILVSDTTIGTLIKENGDCNKRMTPASTFKLALSLMGFDSSYLVNEEVPALPFYDGYVAVLESHKKTSTPRYWMANSVVWFSQRFTEWLGKDRFQHYVDAFQYGNQDLSGDADKNNGLTKAWLSSSLKISPREQVYFLERLVNRQLPVSTHAFDVTERISLVTTLANGWDVHGKTGSGRVNTDEGTQAEVGWFIGWAKKGNHVVSFAHNIQDEKKEASYAGPRAKAEFLELLPSILTNLK